MVEVYLSHYIQNLTPFKWAELFNRYKVNMLTPSPSCSEYVLGLLEPQVFFYILHKKFPISGTVPCFLLACVCSKNCCCLLLPSVFNYCVLEC